MRLDWRGFSLLEILIAVIVLSMVLLGFSASFFLIENTNTSIQRRFQAVNFARETLEDLLVPTRLYATDPDLSTASGGVHNSDSATLVLALPANCNLPQKTRSYQVVELKEAILGVDTLIGKQITVTVGWTEGVQTKTEQLSGLVIPK